MGFGIRTGIYDQKLPYSQTASFILLGQFIYGWDKRVSRRKMIHNLRFQEAALFLKNYQQKCE